jgi:hypothetical protein
VAATFQMLLTEHRARNVTREALAYLETHFGRPDAVGFSLA